MSEILSRIHLNVRQIAAVAAFLGVAAVAQMCIPSLLGVMIDKGVGSGSAGMVAGIAAAMVALAAASCGTSVAAARPDNATLHRRCHEMGNLILARENPERHSP